MTDREKAIVMAYTGTCMLAGDKLGIYYQYIQEKLGHCVMTHELAYPEVQDAIKETAKDDFIGLCRGDEPRVMTLEEVRQERLCWIEDEDDGMMTRLFPAAMFGIGEYADGSKSYMFLAQKPWAADVNNYEWWYIIADYGQTWRCWSSRPTDEQREATPWN